MANAIDKVVNVQISIEDAGVAQAGFGTPLILGPHCVFSERARTYTDPADMLADGFAETDAEYRAALAFFSQDPPPSQAIVGRKKVDKCVVGVTSTDNLTDYEITIKGVDVSYTSSATATEQEIIEGLETAIGLEAGLTSKVTATAIEVKSDGSTTLTWLLYIDDTESGSDGLLISDLTGLSVGNPLAVRRFVIGSNADGAYSLTFTINGVANVVTYTASSKTKAQITEALVAAINVCFAGIASPDLSASLGDWVAGFVDPSSDGVFWLLDIDNGATNGAYVTATTANITETDLSGETWSAAIDAVEDYDASWYPIGITSRKVADQLAVAAKIQPMVKVFGTAFPDTYAKTVAPASDTTSLPAQLKTLGYTRTFSIFNALAHGNGGTITNGGDPFIEFGWMGECLTTDLDNETLTWAYKNIIGATADNITATQITNLIGDPTLGSGGKNTNIYTSILGDSVTRLGKVASGEHIDVIIGRDWLATRMYENIWGVMKSVKKIPFTSGGIALIVNQILKTLKLGIATNFLDFDPDLGPSGVRVTYPSIDAISASDKSARILSGIKFQAKVAGAIHVVKITGTIVVS